MVGAGSSDVRQQRKIALTRGEAYAAVVVGPGEGRVIAVGSGGAGVTVKASTIETGDLYTIWEGRVPAGTFGAGPHYHRERDEFVRLEDGRRR